MAVKSAIGSQMPQQNIATPTVVPAPVKGVDSRMNLSEENPTTCIYAYNILPSEYGMRVRDGFRPWAENLETAPDTGLGVRTIIPYEGVQSDASDRRLFVTTNEGIWDATDDQSQVTPTPAAPVLVYAFVTDTTDAAGYGNFTHYTDASGDATLFYADSGNGLLAYDPLEADPLLAWSAATGITVTGGGSFPVEEITYVVVHKQRIWFVQKNTNVGFYLPVGSQQGVATAFYFASKFKHGGSLVGLYNWTRDGGDGVDDFLVAISRGGDVIPYQGTDPSLAETWSSVGTFFIGVVPTGGQIASEYGGDLYMLSHFGVISMSSLLQGTDVQDISSLSTTYKIARLLRLDLIKYGGERGWEIRYLTNRGILVINTPKRDNDVNLQYVLNLTTDGWGFWRGVPMLGHDAYNGFVYFGRDNNSLYIMDVDTDYDDLLASPVEIEWSILTAYSSLGAPAVFKRGTFIRPNWLARGIPKQDVQFSYDYAIQELPVGGTEAEQTFGVWDLSNWDDALWITSQVAPQFTLRGGSGIGRTLAVAMRGSSITRSTLLSWDIIWNTGGMT